MSSSDELQIALAPGEGNTGLAFSRGAPTIQTFENVMKDSSVGTAAELARVDRTLRWIISVPVLSGGKAVAVLNVDGVREERSANQLTRSVGTMLYWSGLLELILQQASAAAAT